ncbi:MAG: Gfo/Idh/MocA family oxidoreductase, partial [Planctomycetota bacterium]
MAKSTSDGGGADRDSYALKSAGGDGVAEAPELPYRPKRPVEYQPAIGLIGCGGITAEHLTAYQNAGYQVVAFADVDIEKARRRRDEFYPEADCYAEASELLRRTDVGVVDIAT